MATTYYAWTRFYKKVDEYGRPQEEIMPGEVVTAEMLGINDEQFEQHVLSGSVRRSKYPVPKGHSGVSPAEHMKAKAAAIAASEDITAFDEPDDEDEDDAVEEDANRGSLFRSVS